IINPDTIDNLELTIDKQMNDLAGANGKILSYEFITERKIKDFIAKRFYILKFEKYFLKFDFSLYKTSSGWTITSFNYNSELNELFY
ncbi:hypothetical protein, partial [Rhizobium leguminosarum]|uniref:hypothetical protein n=1 Tax=Rhizobium leguminosarum TaxID=384 RepID=UPI003F95B267